MQPTYSPALLRVAAEHESAHAVVAAALGHRWQDVIVRSDMSGECRVVAPAGPVGDVMRLAGDIWVRLLMDEPPPEGYVSSDTDTPWVALRRSRAELAGAQLAAYRILKARRAEVLALADLVFTSTTWAPARE